MVGSVFYIYIIFSKDAYWWDFLKILTTIDNVWGKKENLFLVHIGLIDVKNELPIYCIKLMGLMDFSFKNLNML